MAFDVRSREKGSRPGYQGFFLSLAVVLVLASVVMTYPGQAAVQC